MRYRARPLLVALVLTVPLTGVLVAADPSAAAVKTTGVGNITCSYGDTIKFNPPLTGGAGVAGHMFERITLKRPSLGSCTGTVTAGEVPTAGHTRTVSVFEVRGSKINGTWYAGSCPGFVNYLWPHFNPTYRWTAPDLRLKHTGVSDVAAEPTSNPSTGDLGFEYSGTATGSWSGPATIDAYFTDASSAALEACGPGSSISSLTVDPTQSSITLGSSGGS